MIDRTGWVIDSARWVIDRLSTGWASQNRLALSITHLWRQNLLTWWAICRHTPVYHPPAGGAISRGDGDAGTLARSPRCRHEHDAQRCRHGMTKGIDARMGRDSERGSMRSTKARPRLRRGEPERSRLKQAARPYLRPRCHPRPLRRLLAAPATRRAARPGVSSPAAGQTYPTPRQACIPASRWT